MSDAKVTKVRALREKRGLRVLDLVLKTGLGMSTIANADRGLLSERTAKLLAPALGVKPEELLSEVKRRGA